MAADMFTKHFTNRDKWESVCSLIGVVPNTFIDNRCSKTGSRCEGANVALCAIPFQHRRPPPSSMSVSPLAAFQLASATRGRAALLSLLQYYAPERVHAAREAPGHKVGKLIAKQSYYGIWLYRRNVLG